MSSGNDGYVFRQIEPRDNEIVAKIARNAFDEFDDLVH